MEHSRNRRFFFLDLRHGSKIRLLTFDPTPTLTPVTTATPLTCNAVSSPILAPERETKRQLTRWGLEVTSGHRSRRPVPWGWRTGNASPAYVEQTSTPPIPPRACAARWVHVTPNPTARKQGRGGEGGRGCTRSKRSRSRMTVDPRVPAASGRNKSGFHRLGTHRAHHARSALRCSASRNGWGGRGRQNCNVEARVSHCQRKYGKREETRGERGKMGEGETAVYGT